MRALGKRVAGIIYRAVIHRIGPMSGRDRRKLKAARKRDKAAVRLSDAQNHVGGVLRI